MEKRKNLNQIITYSGAFMALLIGAGFATGQEILQFFSAYGLKGFIGIIICFVLFAFAGISFVNSGYYEKFDKPNDIYKFICGKKIGTIFDYYSVFFIFLTYIVMIAGAQATAVQHFNSPKFLGGSIMAIIVISVVTFGLRSIVEVIGKIGPFIVIMTIFIGLVSIINNIGNLNNGLEIMSNLVASGKIKIASSNFLFSSGSYVGFNMILLVAFFTELGKKTEIFKNTQLGIIGGAVGFSISIFIMNIAIILYIPELYNSQIPVLILSDKISPMLTNVFSIVIMLAIFTTSAPLLWTVSGRFFKEETLNYKLFTIIIGIVGALIGLTLKFDALVNIVYVVNGYIGMILLICMIFRKLSLKNKK